LDRNFNATFPSIFGEGHPWQVCLVTISARFLFICQAAAQHGFSLSVVSGFVKHLPREIEQLCQLQE